MVSIKFFIFNIDEIEIFTLQLPNFLSNNFLLMITPKKQNKT